MLSCHNVKADAESRHAGEAEFYREVTTRIVFWVSYELFGDYPACWDRRRGFKEAGVPDGTEYKYEMSSEYPTYYSHEEEEK